ncbi:MAG: ribulose-phosphate 3-epimerase [Candidatus Thorarchaeota archaeon]
MKKVAISVHALEDFRIDFLKGIEGFDYIHVDVMDGKFVKSVHNNLNVFRILKQTYETPIIAHLMVINPLDYINKIIDFIDIFLFHFEINSSKTEIIEQIRKKSKMVGIAINPDTDISKILPYLEILDLVLIMSVKPGWSGQNFIPNIIDKINQLADYKKRHKFLIDVDGGVNPINAKLLKNTDILSSSSAILRAKNPNRIIKLLKESDEKS